MADSDDRSFLVVDPETAWLETVTIGGFRVWHIIAICLGILLTLVVMVCCCIRFRIPRTKQEIEADYQRKQITKKFREKLQQIKNSDMDDMDLQKAVTSNFNNYNDIYSDTTALLPPPQPPPPQPPLPQPPPPPRLPNNHHLAWQDHHQHTLLSLSVVEAGYIALHHVTKEMITQRIEGFATGGGVLRQTHIVVYPSTTYRQHNRGSTQFLIENPMVHKKPPPPHTYYADSYKYGGCEPKRYHLSRDCKHCENNNNIFDDSSEIYMNSEETYSITDEDRQHSAYGCNL